MKPESRHFSHIDQCDEYINPWPVHPFGLDLPEREPGMPRVRISFVGTHATETSVAVFLAHIRFWAGYVDGCKATKLRVISMPFAGGQKNQNYVFFEMWATSTIVTVSGETTDFSGGGNLARQKLEDVFAVLANIYGLEIERVQLEQPFSTEDLRNLYADQGVPA